MSRQWCGRSVLYSCRKTSTAAWTVSRLGQSATSSRSFRHRGLVEPSTFPVVVGEAGRVGGRAVRVGPGGGLVGNRTRRPEGPLERLLDLRRVPARSRVFRHIHPPRGSG